MTIACFLQQDLSIVRVRGGGVDETWRAPALERHEGDSAVAIAQARAREAARFVATTVGRARRLGPVVIGAQDAICARVAAPSAVPDVVTAALSRRARAWSDEPGSTGVQALAPARKSSRAPRPSATENPTPPGSVLTVIELHDGLICLFLDELDRRGMSPSSVQTLWHTLATSLAPARSAPGDLSAVVLGDEGSTIWAWARGGTLVAGGQTRTPVRASDEPAAAPVPHRLALDWLAWGAQLGAMPTAATVLAPAPDALADALAGALPGARVERKSAADVLAAALDAAAASAPTSDDPRVCLTDLTNRPGRAHRWLGVWSAAAIALIAVTVAAVGVRQRTIAHGASALAADTSATMRDRVSSIEPRFADDPAPERALASLLAQEREQHKPIEAPPPPRPIFAELLRLSGALAAVLAEKDDADVKLVKLDELGGEAQIAVPDFATGEAILDRLGAGDALVRWSGVFLGAAPPTTQRLSGSWREDTP